jgi:hypothetical protein
MTLQRSLLGGSVLWWGLGALGCPLQTSTSSTLPGGATSSTAGGEYVDPKEPTIVGLSVAEATHKIKASGFDGDVEVIDNSELDPSCKADTVCGFSPRRWYLNQDHRMALHVNRKLAIGAPR